MRGILAKKKIDKRNGIWTRNECKITATMRNLFGGLTTVHVSKGNVEDGRFAGGEIYGTSHRIRVRLLLIAFYACTQTSPHNAINSARGRREPKAAYRFGR